MVKLGWQLTSYIRGGGLGHNEGSFGTTRNWMVTGADRSVVIKPNGVDSLDMQQPLLENCRYGQGGAWLRFFTESAGSISAVSYQIVRRNIVDIPNITPNPSEIRYMLLRTSTAGGLLHQEPGGNVDGYDLSPGSSIYSYPNSALVGSSTYNVIAENVIDFGIRFYIRDQVSRDLHLLFPRDASAPPGPLNGPNDSHRQHLAQSLAGTASPSQFPEFADVFVRILTDEGSRLLENLEAGRTSGDWWDIAEANSRVFTQRIRIASQPY